MTTLIPPSMPLAQPTDAVSAPRSRTRSILPSDTRAGSTVIVASDGRSASDGAIRFALAHFDAKASVIEVLTVVADGSGSAPVKSNLPPGVEDARHGAQREAVEVQVARLSGKPLVYRLTVREGSPAYAISTLATERHATLVIVGLGQHDFAERLIGEETAVELARVARVPVLAVPEDASGVVLHAVVAIDFSEIGARAAQAAIDAVGDHGIVELVHVTPNIPEYPTSPEGQQPYMHWARRQLDALIARLVVTRGVTMTSAVICGRTAHALLEHIRVGGADLVAAGTHGRGFVVRAMLGSVTTDLLRGARCAVLMVPRDPLSTPAAIEPWLVAPELPPVPVV